MLTWQTTVLLMPAFLLVLYSYFLRTRQLKSEKKHTQDMGDVHMRMVEALALTIEAKDQSTHDHLQRVKIFCVEVGKELKLSSLEMQALSVASLLHDIGKLAVPEYIISKPGKLSLEEFEKVKIHPTVGAEILERVGFPYPVAPIVRAHHEKWDGTGYPKGLRGTEIPIGARILSAVDYVDALASDRQYRRGMTANEVMEKLREQSGKSFDPNVVAVLRRRFLELETMVRRKAQEHPAKDQSQEAPAEADSGGHEPAAGLAVWDAPAATRQHSGVLDLISAARQEGQALFDLSRDLGASLSLSETLSVLSVKLKNLIPHDAIAVYILRGEKLIPEYVNGEEFRSLASLQIPLGEGLCGWVAQNQKVIVNGNPAVEPGATADPMKATKLKSALAAPLLGLKNVVGVLALYRLEASTFTSENLRVLLAVTSKTGLAVENALKFQQAESSSTTDYLTGLPNARSLFLQLDRELARCERDSSRLTVMVCDLKGFKHINERFGSEQGNHVLRAFAEKLQATCRKYDHVARMSGDEFVVIAPAMPEEAMKARAKQLREIAQQVGIDVTGEDMMTVDIGYATYPDDAADAESLLEKADRKMYAEKDKQASGIKEMRRSARAKCCLPAELQIEGSEAPVMGTVVNVSTGGCFVESGAFLGMGTKIKLTVWEGGNVTVQGKVARSRPGAGFAIEFADMTKESREQIRQLVQTVQARAAEYGAERKYLAVAKF
jgi:diguanylate cyclase (GGDEF)-like protein/putative nucleotidyltransferase with HDIG domain